MRSEHILHSNVVVDRRRGSGGGMMLWVAALSLAALSCGCVNSSSDHPAARKIAQFDYVGSVSTNGRYVSFVKTGQYDELFVRDLMSGEDRRLTGRPGEVGSYGAPVSPSGDQVAYSWGNSVRVVGLDGSGLRVLYQEAGAQGNPQDWSANEEEVLIRFSSRRAGTEVLGVLSTTTGALRQVKTRAMLWGHTGTVGSTARFSRDGRWIAFDTRADPGSANRDISVVSVDGRLEAPVVTHPATDRLLEWSPDGQRVFFVSDRAGTWDLWAVRIREGKANGPAEMIRRDVGPVLRSAGFTKDGSLHGVIEGWDNDVYLATMGASGKVENTTKVATKVAWNSTVQWSPDGRSLVYARGYGNQEDPFVLAVRNSETADESRHPLKVTRFGGHFFTPNWAPDGRAVLSQGRHEGYRGSKLDSQGLYRIDIETGEATPFVQGSDLCPPDCVEWPVWSPAGEAIFVRWRPRGIVARDLQSGTERELYRSLPTEEISHLAVSPDGQRLAFTWGEPQLLDAGRSGVRVMSTSGQDVSDLLSLPALSEYWLPLFAIGWMPDSRHLIYAPTRWGEKRVELKRMSIDGGLPEDLGLVLEGIWPYGLSVHPDGRRIVFTAGSPPREELWVIPKVLEAAENAR